MKRNLLLFLLSASALFSYAQTKDPVTWSTAYKSISATEGEITITGNIDNGWHTYSQRPSDAGNIPTSFTFAPSSSYALDGKVQETGAQEEFDKAFDAKIYSFAGKALFTQKIKVSGKNFLIPIKVEYMACNNMMCLPPKTVNLQVKVN